MNVTITLIMYWSIAFSLVCGGLYALKKGFSLILEGKGKTKEESLVEFFGLKANVSSIGSLVRITAFMWGWAAKSTLPGYKDDHVQIAEIRQDLMKAEAALASLKEKNSAKIAQMAKLDERLAATSMALEKSQIAVAAAADGNKEKQKKLEEKLEAQRKSFSELQTAIKINDQEDIDKKFILFKAATMDIENTIKYLFEGV